MQRLIPAVLAVLLCVGLPRAASTQSSDEVIAVASSAQMLEGLKGVYVQFGDISQVAKDDGLSEAALRTGIEVRLREAGIAVWDEPQWKSATGMPMLDVSVECSKWKPDIGYAFVVKVELLETGLLDRLSGSNKIIRGLGLRTWSSEYHGYCGVDRFPAGVEDPLHTALNEFCNDYLKANPKP